MKKDKSKWKRTENATNIIMACLIFNAKIMSHLNRDRDRDWETERGLGPTPTKGKEKS